MAPSKASKGKGPARIDDNKTIAGVAKLSKEQLFNSLEESGIKFDENSLKPELQAVWALRELGLVTKGESPDEYLLNHATNWFSMSVKELIDEIKERNYNDAGNRWDRIEALIRDEYANPMGGVPQKKDQPDVGEKALRKMDIGSGAGPSNSKKASQHPDPAVLNLLLTLLYGDVSKFPARALSSCPIKAAATVTKLISQMETFKTDQAVATAFSAPNTQATQLLSWLSSQGPVLAPAPADMKIPGFKVNVHQFIVVQQDETLQAAFDEQMNLSSGKSGMVWHGTPISNVRSILRDGFATSKDGFIWSAEDAEISYDFSFRFAIYPQYEPIARWGGCPYKSWGALLGCEVAGGGQRTPYTGTKYARLIKNPASIIVRYILLLPPSEYPANQVPKRNAVEPTMVAAFKKIRSRSGGE